MRVAHRQFSYYTLDKFQLIDITSDVERAVRESGVKDGIAVVHVPHATAGILLNENEDGLVQDIIRFLKELTRPGDEWQHNRIDDNAHAHIGSSIIGSSRVIPVVNGSLYRGTWQNIFLVEMDGPRSRRQVIVTVIGE